MPVKLCGLRFIQNYISNINVLKRLVVYGSKKLLANKDIATNMTMKT